MAKNYVAKTFLRGNERRIISNKKIGSINSSLTERQEKHDVPMNIGILNKENLDMSLFKELYAQNDSEKKRPYYIATVATQGYTGMPGVNKKKINVGDYGVNSLTFFNVDDTPVSRVGIIPEDYKGMPQDITNEDIDRNGFSVCVSLDPSNPVRMINKGFPIGKDRYDCFFTSNMELLKRDVFDGYIRGIPPVKMIDPQTKEEYLELGMGPGIGNYDNLEWLQIGSGKFSYSSTRLGEKSYSFFKIKMNENYPTSYDAKTYFSDQPVTISGFKVPYGLPSTLNDGRYWIDNLSYKTTYSSSLGLNFAFLYDGKDYWIMTVTMRNYQREVNTKDKTIECVYGIALMKIQDIPSRIEDVNVKEGLCCNFYYDDTPKYINEISKMLQVVEPVKTDPDIVGPGDPYDKIDNVDKVIGGDVNLDKDIDSDDLLPDSGFGNVLAKQDLLSAYDLTQTNMIQYSTTLKMLYKASEDIFFGGANHNIADRITKNTVSLNYLPVPLSVTEFEPSTFAMGHTAISASGDYNKYVYNFKNDLATANKLKKQIITRDIPLGIIPHNYDNFLDFAPYSSASLFIPYIGMVSLPINMIQSNKDMTYNLRLSFRFNIFNGDFTCLLFRDYTENGKDIKECLTHWNGNCATAIPLSVDDNSGVIREGAKALVNMMNLSSNVGKGTGISNSTSTSTSHNTTAGKTGNFFGDAKYSDSDSLNTSAGSGRSSHNNEGANVSKSVSLPSAPPVLDSQQHMIGNSSVTGSAGLMDSQKIILTVERPQMWKYYDYSKLAGFPTKKTATLASIETAMGDAEECFIKVTNMHMKCKATSSEKGALAGIMGNGVLVTKGKMPRPKGDTGCIYLYNNLSEDNATVKTLEDAVKINGTIKNDNVSVETPYITLSAGKKPMTYNYAYIPSLDRYYFIGDYVIEGANHIGISLVEDYLSTWWNAIKPNVGLIDASQYFANFYLNDPNVPVQQDTTIFRRKYFAGPFGGFSIIMTCLNTGVTDPVIPDPPPTGG